MAMYSVADINHNSTNHQDPIIHFTGHELCGYWPFSERSPTVPQWGSHTHRGDWKEVQTARHMWSRYNNMFALDMYMCFATGQIELCFLLIDMFVYTILVIVICDHFCRCYILFIIFKPILFISLFVLSFFIYCSKIFWGVNPSGRYNHSYCYCIILYIAVYNILF